MRDFDQLFEDSFTRLIGKGPGETKQGFLFFERFYEIFTSKSPAVNIMFAGTDMHRQIRMLQRSVYQMTSMYVTRVPNHHINKVAQSQGHTGHKIAPELYELWLDALIETVRELDPEFTHEIELAWRMAMTPGILLMKHYGDKPLPG